MSSFKDEHGRTWTPRVTTYTIQRFEELSGIDLFNEVFGFVETHKDLMQDGKLTLANDELFGLAVEFARAITHGRATTLNVALYVSVEKQAAKLGLGYEDFCELLVGEVAGEAIRAAGEGYWHFFRQAATGLGDLGALKVTTSSVPGAGRTSTGSQL